MSYITALFYDRFMSKAEDACLKEWRHGLLKQVSGQVLEVGAGTGANIKFYSDEVTKLVVTEPDEHMRKLLKEQVIYHQLENVGVSAEQQSKLKPLMNHSTMSFQHWSVAR